MYQIKIIFKFYLTQLLRNIWLNLLVLVSVLFMVIYAYDLFWTDRGQAAFVSSYFQQNLLLPFITITYIVWIYYSISKGEFCDLMDSYSFRNWQLYFGVYAAVFIVFLFYSILQFSVIMLIRTLVFHKHITLGTIFIFLFQNIINVLFLSSFGAFCGVVLKESILGYIISFLVLIINMFLDRFTIKALSIVEIIHLNIFKSSNITNFDMTPVEKDILFLSRLFLITFSLFLLFLTLTIFKTYREKTNKLTNYITLTVLFSICIAVTVLYWKFSIIPEKQVLRKILYYNNTVLNVHIDDYSIEGELNGNKLSLKVNFNAYNNTNNPQKLRFYLASNFNIKYIKVDGNLVEFQRKGDLVNINQTIQPKEQVNCALEYQGSLQEFAKCSDEAFEYIYKPYAYMTSNMVFVPGNAGWYPMEHAIYNYIPRKKWLYPGREIRPRKFNSNIKSKFPIVEDQNIIYGYKNMEKSVYGGVEYYYLSIHKESVKKLHQYIKNEVKLLNELVPLPRIQVFEVPQNSFLAGLEQNLNVENGYGRIMISENLFIKAGTNNLLEMDKHNLDWAVFSGWFNLSDEGFNQNMDSNLVKEGYISDTLPGIRLGPPMLALSIKYLFDYIYEQKYNPHFDEKEFIENVKRNFGGDASEPIVALIKKYKENDIEKTKIFLRELMNSEKQQKLNVEDLIELLSH
ncbi:ABC-type transport system involved in multi-copper enzyme maturation permease subunit [Caldicellulosiruptor bescii]|uniref:Uncharacterized protein n=2 Tax=Caldicellulosiruptor bescii TaxID=31899 RepID=B9MQU7_CALBD|nr:ABC transporter permease [Caldicellulosiruptor bescii]ACM60051.1 hypothetical protein Athe_0947 [Caldicellulosiruptor bescii DSM 6725]PBC87463.1 ABC-type transport system involved in multi-copper enzyme maturation permease subunit [Caldicellulosiruptor bescii]PBC90396.1 ABC-type transport system involved in multi-copper enzyme maturation permease subunit [Caldicellulosiruptor bescii]PBD04172.1 ABC-type transport system involved in multi-copper enzyme maturation permease subunit [Caldicellulo